MRIATRKPAPWGAVRGEFRGLVSPAGFDEQGEVTAVCVLTDQGKPCFVLSGGVGAEVRDYLKRYVAVSGRVEFRAGIPYIHVESVVPMIDPEETSLLE